MRIGIDLFAIIPQVTGGLTSFFQMICKQMSADYPHHEFHLFCTAANADAFNFRLLNVIIESLPSNPYFYHSFLAGAAKERGLDVMIRSYPVNASFPFPFDRQVVVIPDMQHVYCPEFFSREVLRDRRRSFHQSLSTASAIGTLSEHARSTIIQHASTRCQDVFLVPPAYDNCSATHDETVLTREERNLLPSIPFFIMPGNLWPHKNHRRTLEAFRLFVASSSERVEFVLTGHPEGWEDLRAEFSDQPVRHLGFVRPEFLHVLLRKARALTFFSLYEGFGIPLLEAFAAGTPVICSDSTSLREVGGKAVLSCDPADTAAMAALMRLIFEDETCRKRLVEEGKRRLGFYSWRKSAQNLIDVCERVVKRATSFPKLGWHECGKLYALRRWPMMARILLALRHPRHAIGRRIRARLGSGGSL